jgi:glucosamine-6-phosphate deaminase
MVIKLFDNKLEMAKVAAEQAASALREAIQRRGKARIIAATGAAQFEFLEALTALPGIDWKKVEMFHLDEYVGMAASHPASFCRFLRERLIQKTGITNHHLLSGEKDPGEVIRETTKALNEAPIDVAFVGIGENGHLAFNDPPADFETREPYLVVTLDEACRRQQVGEGWFASLDEVPTLAISMSCRQILASTEILVIVPDARKAEAVRAACEGPVTPLVPASLLQEHDRVTVYLDPPAASRLAQPPRMDEGRN